MEKAIRITAIVSTVLQILYLFLGRLLGGVVLGPALTRIPVGASEQGIAYYLISQIIIGGAFVLIYAIFMVLMIYASKGKSEKIGVEITGFIVIGLFLSVANGLISIAMNYIVGITTSASTISTYSSMTSGSSFFGWINAASSLLMIISLAMSLCRKKFVIPLEFELGYDVEDELGRITPQEEYGRGYYNGNVQQDYQYSQNSYEGQNNQ